MHPSLKKLVGKMKASPRIRGIFYTGAIAAKMNPSSDIDLVVVLDKNHERIKSVYTTIEGRFSDIFFFDVEFLDQLKNKGEVSGNNFDGIFLEWLGKGKIEYDPENLLSDLKSKIEKTPPLQRIADSEKRDLWIKINYNFIANSRYYNSGDELYRKALEFRLLYSVIELITAYFSFRAIPWRGEKAAIRHLEQNDIEFLATFQKYSGSNTLAERMEYYGLLFDKTFSGGYQKWTENFTIPISQESGYDENLLSFWNNLTR